MRILADSREKLLTALPENNRLERIWLLAKTEFRKRYYESFLGLVWAFINPLAQLIIYYYVFTVVFKTTTPNFALFIFLGIVIWMFFSETAGKGMALINSKRFLLENIQINKLDIYYASILSTFLGFLFNFSVYFITSLFFDIRIGLSVLLFPFLIFNLILFILAVQIILSIIHIFIRDIIHLWSITVFCLFWLSGIVFEVDPGATWKTTMLAFLTPVFGVISNARAILIYGEGFDWTLFVYDYIYAVALLMVGLYFMKRYFGRALELL